MNNDTEKRIVTCLDYFNKAIDGTISSKISLNGSEPDSLDSIVSQMSMYLAQFNFYPSEYKSSCCEVAFFTSLTGKRWNLKKQERIDFEMMFKLIIKHCQGSCEGITKNVVIIADNWDDDVVSFWNQNIAKMKSKGIKIQVNLLVGKNPNTYDL